MASRAKDCPPVESVAVVSLVVWCKSLAVERDQSFDREFGQ